MTSINKADLAAGLLFMGFGALFGVQSLGLELGTATRLGPGYFPLAVSVVLTGLGATIAFRAAGRADEAIGPFAVRGMIFILAAPVFFGLTVRGLGFVPAVFATTLIACLAGLRVRPLPALLLAFAVTLFCTLVFSFGLGLPFRRFGPWLSFLGV